MEEQNGEQSQQEIDQEQMEQPQDEIEQENDWEVDEEEDPNGVIDEEQEGQNDEEHEDGDDDQLLGEEQAYSGEEDVDIYGEQLDEEDMEAYENEGDSQEQLQFQQENKPKGKKRRNIFKDAENQQQDQGEDLINDQFDHFREVELQNKEEQAPISAERTHLEQQIQKFQDKIISKKDWVLNGEVKSTQRPVNSLLDYDLQFKTGIKISQQITPQVNQEMENMIKQRILDELYDDRVRYQHSHVLRQQYSSLKQVSTEKSKLGLGQLYEAEFKNYLGLGEKKDDKLKKQILDAFKEVNYYLDSLSNFNFVPKQNPASKSDAVISQEKVPLNMFNADNNLQSSVQRKVKSEKQENKKAKRVKNKRIERQRRKEQTRKKLNKKIEYGGLTKFQAKAIKKGAKNNIKKDPIKYNKSSKFFDSMNQQKKGKPNPHINKLKI